MLRANQRGPAALCAWPSYPISDLLCVGCVRTGHLLISVSLREPLFPEDRQINASAHLLVAGVFRMQMIPGIVIRVEVRGIRRILRDLIEVDHTIKRAAVADPVIHRRAPLLALV